jgi:hypothetical protein
MEGLTANPAWTAAELGTWIVDKYYESYGNNQTQSAIDLSKMEMVGTVASELAGSLIQSWDADPAAVKEKARSMMTAIDGAVIREKHGESWKGSHGLAIYFPVSADRLNRDYNETVIDFAADTKWDEFLDEFVTAMSGSWVALARNLTTEFAKEENTQHVDLHHFCRNLTQMPDDLDPGYTLAETAYDFEDISASGTRLSIGDDDYAYLRPDFSFRFAGNDHTGISVSDNGVIYFEDAPKGSYLNSGLPGTEVWGEAFIAPFWSDIYLESQGAIYHEVKGSAPDRRLIVQWEDVYLYDGIDGGTFQATLYETANTIRFQYKDVDFGDPETDKGAMATVGIQISLYKGLQYAFNSPKLTDGMALLFTPATGGCTYSLSATAQSFPKSGGRDDISVTAGSGCDWTAASDVAWITIQQGNSGTGNGTVSYAVAENTLTKDRTGMIRIAGQTFTVTQSAGCSFAVSPTTETFQSTGGNGTVTLSATRPECAWQAASKADWITITSEKTGTGNGTIAYVVAENTHSADRTGHIVVGGKTVTIEQEKSDAPQATLLQNGLVVKSITQELGNILYYKISVPADASRLMVSTWGESGDVDLYVKYGSLPEKASFDYQSKGVGNSETVDVAAPDGGDWYIMLYASKAISNVSLLAAYNLSGCPILLDSPALFYPAKGGTGAVTAEAGEACYWTAVADADWIRITSPNHGAGNGTVTYSVQANTTSDERSGSVAIGGARHDITQAAAGAASVTTLQNGVTMADISGGTDDAVFYKITVPAGQAGLLIETAGGTGDCDLYVRFGAMPTLEDYDEISLNYENEERIKIVSPATGDWYLLLYGYDAFTGVSLTATYSDTMCGYTALPESISMGQSGGTDTISVTATVDTCGWQASTQESWITITAGESGAGSGTVQISAAAFDQPGFRYGYVDIEDQFVQIVQSGLEPDATPLSNETAVTASGAQGEMVYFTIDVPEGQSALYVETYGGAGDCDLIVTDDLGAIHWHYTSAYYGNEEFVYVPSPEAGKWYVILEGYEAFTDVEMWPLYYVALGDITGDGFSDLEDAIVGLKVLTGIPSPLLREDYTTANVDVNGNNRIDLREVIYLLQWEAGF